MKRLRFLGSLAALALAMGSCSDDSLVKDKSAQGTLVINATVKSEVTSSTNVTSSSRAADGEKEAWEVTADDLFLMITNSEGATIQYFLSTYDASTRFEVGAYDVGVRYGFPNDEGFCQPYYYGVAKGVVVESDKTTPVSITAELQRALFYVKYSDNVVNNLAIYSVDLKSANGEEAINYPATETRPAYMNPEDVDIVFNITTNDGMSSSVLVKTVAAEARHSYSIKLDVTGNFSSENGATITVAFDDDLVEEDPIEIKLDAEALASAAPTITAVGFDPGVAIEHTEGAAYGDDLIMNVYAPGKLAKVELETTNASLINGWPASIELLSATEAEQATLQDLGLWAIGLWKNPDKVAQLNFKDIIANIELVTSNADVTFALIVTDLLGRSTEPMVLDLHVNPFVLDMSIYDLSTMTLALGDAELSATISYNGSYISDNVTIQYNDVYGNWYDATATFAETETETENVYSVAISDLPTSGDLQISALYIDGERSNSINLVRTYPEIALTVDDKDVWATHATFTCLAADGSSVLDLAAATYAVYISTDDSNYTLCTHRTADGDNITITGLTAGTTYYAKVTLSGDSSDLSNALMFTTEEATQLPNASFEEWTTQQPTTQYQIVYYPGPSTSGNDWDTMNLLTTSTSGTGTSLFSYGGTGYRAHSGTQYTTSARTGTYAAKIMTIGWGSGNTSFGTSGACANVTPGQLYLGSYDTSSQSPNYGYAFASRPSSMTFFYKLCVVSTSDYASAEITVYDASDNVIANGYKKIDEYMNTISGATYTTTDDGLGNYDFAEVNIPLTYTAGCAKAAKISVVFKSSDNSDMWKWSSSCLCYPGSANYNNGIYSGARLVIDDVTLNY